MTTKKRKKKHRRRDPEIVTLEIVFDRLNRLATYNAQRRVLAYMCARLCIDATKLGVQW